MKELADLRMDYTRARLHENDAHPDPLEQFALWLREALEHEACEPTAMTLSTVSAQGIPTARIVLLKGLEQGAFRFFTNYESRKARDLAHNPQACLSFFWPSLQRQVRINGMVSKVERSESEAYFRTRPLDSRLGAWASRQSSPLTGRAELEEALAQAQQRFADGNIPVPEHWGGYKLAPQEIEFWQGGAARLHDRLVYTLANGVWTLGRLAP